jgi:uncharacterized protein
LPTALVGGFIVLDENLYKFVTGLILQLASIVLALRRSSSEEPERTAPLWGPSARGIRGVRVRAYWRWRRRFSRTIADRTALGIAKQTAALSAPFILANSAVGLVGAMYVGQTPASGTWLYAVAALVGAALGTSAGLRLLSQNMTRYVLAAILASAGLQLLFF